MLEAGSRCMNLLTACVWMASNPGSKDGQLGVGAEFAIRPVI